jgi:hypothetical protein
MKKLQRFLSMLILMVLLSSAVLPTLVYAETYEEVWGQAKVDREPEDDGGNWLLTAVESLLAGIVARLANCVNFLISKSVGQQVIIDDLIFNYQGQDIEERTVICQLD